MKRFAEFVIDYRMLFLIIIILATIFFGYYLKDLDIRTNFSELLPTPLLK